MHLRLFGIILISLGIALGFGQSGFTIQYRSPFAYVSPGEFNIWLVYILFITPGACALTLNQSVPNFLTQTNVKSVPLVMGSVVLGALTVFYRLARLFFMRDLPVTDEEYSVQFGGRLIASGQWMAELNLDYSSMPTLFLYERDGAWASFDFLGIQLAWAVSELTGTGPWLFALLSAMTVVALFFLLQDVLDDTRWALVGTLIYASSPMATLLSLTTHAHVLSRFILVIFIMLMVRTMKHQTFTNSVLAGFVFGLGVLCRPAEFLTLGLPFILFGGVMILGGRAQWRLGIGFLAGGLPCALILFAHNFALTGQWWTSPRMAPNPYPSPKFEVGALAFVDDPQILIRRLADNLANNVMFTILYWHGLLGGLLAFMGLRGHKISGLLLLGLIFHSTIALLHDNDGVRVVGPIHFSEWVVPLSICATLGIRELWKSICEIGGQEMGRRSMFCVSFTLFAGAVFATTVIGLSIRASNHWHESFYSYVNSQIPKGAIVLAPRNAYFWQVQPPGSYNGSWVFEARSPKPDLTDDVLYLRYVSGSEHTVAERFPDRRIFLVRPEATPPLISITEFQKKI